MSRRRGNGVSTSAAPATKRCAVYTRKSTTAGLAMEFSSLDAQREACLAYIERQPGWILIPERYDDGGFTGANLDRPAFQRLVRDIEAGRVDVVVAYKLDRLSRSLRDFARLMDVFEQQGVSFVSVTQQFNTADAMGRLTLNMLMSFAEFEREMTAERTRDKIAASRRRGKWTGGPVPYGYRAEDKRLVVEEHEAAIVREMFALYLDRRDAAAVARELNERGLVPRDGRRRTRSGGPRWTKDSIARVLRSPIHAGLILCGDDLHDAEHEAIVRRELWDAAQAILDSRARETTDHGRNPDYILRGVLRCPLCGGAFTPASTRGKGSREYRYYRCSTRDKHGKKACPAKPLSAPAIEDFVADHLRQATESGALATDVTQRLHERAIHQRGILTAERRALPIRIAHLSAEGTSLAATLGSITGTARRLLEQRIEALGEELGCHENRLAEVERSLAALDQSEADAQWVAQALADFDAIWELMTTENRGRLIRALVEHVVVDEPSGRVTAVLVDLGIGGTDIDASTTQPDHVSP